MPRARVQSLPPLALASDGTAYVNLAAADPETDLKDLLERARQSGRSVFIGVALKPAEARRAARRLNDAAAEAAATLIGAPGVELATRPKRGKR